jgi:thiamine kinase-like enzyme
MPYVPRFIHLFKILLRWRDPAAAEGLWYLGTWLHDHEKDTAGARMAFHHARLLDPTFAGAHYNHAALTELIDGRAAATTLRAWEDYLKAAESDRRQARDTVERVRRHVEELRSATAGKKAP